MAETPPPPDPNAANKAAVDRIRDLAKWLIVILGAIGGTLIAGSQLADIGSAEGLYLGAAIGGIVLSLSGVALAIGFVVRVLMPEVLTLPQLASKDKKSPAAKLVESEPELLFERAETIPEFEQVRKKARKEEKDAATALSKKPRDEALKAKLAAAAAERAQILKEVNLFLGYALVAQVKASMNRALAAMLTGAVVAALGIALFAWATNQESAAADATAAVPKQPASVVVRLFPSGREDLSARIGEECAERTLHAVALGGEPDALELIVVPTAKCDPIRFTLTDSIGTVESEEDVDALPTCPVGKEPEPPCIAY